MNQLYQQEAEQLGAPRLAALLLEMRDSQKIVLEKLRAVEETQAKLMSGFPASDVDGHRRYHQSVIEWRELRNNMVRQALEKMIGAGILGACGWLLLAIWQSFKITVTK